MPHAPGLQAPKGSKHEGLGPALRWERAIEPREASFPAGGDIATSIEVSGATVSMVAGPEPTTVDDIEVVNKAKNVPARETALGGSCDLSQQSSECLSQGEIAIDILVLSKLLQVAPNVTRNFQHFDRNSRLATQFLLKRSGQGQQEIIGRRPLD